MTSDLEKKPFLPELGVNIDHVATVRQARYRGMEFSHLAEPDPVEAALAAERGGATGITAHLRADRRHIQDEDIFRLRDSISTKLNFEMGNTPEILAIALEVRPHDACLVPEERREVTTEGGLDCITARESLRKTIDTLQDAGIRVSLFIDPVEAQIAEAAALGAEFIELHTGAFSNATGDLELEELEKLIAASKLAQSLGLAVNAGHGLNYTNIHLIRKIPNLVELNIGHSIVSRAMAHGMEAATREMLAAIRSCD